MTKQLILRVSVAALLLGVMWVGQSYPWLLLRQEVLVPLMLVLMLGPGLWRLWKNLPHSGKRERWIDRRVD